jgi:hypothetical protein
MSPGWTDLPSTKARRGDESRESRFHSKVTDWSLLQLPGSRRFLFLEFVLHHLFCASSKREPNGGHCRESSTRYGEVSTFVIGTSQYCRVSRFVTSVFFRRTELPGSSQTSERSQAKRTPARERNNLRGDLTSNRRLRLISCLVRLLLRANSNWVNQSCSLWFTFASVCIYFGANKVILLNDDKNAAGPASWQQQPAEKDRAGGGSGGRRCSRDQSCGVRGGTTTGGPRVLTVHCAAGNEGLRRRRNGRTKGRSAGRTPSFVFAHVSPVA